MGLIHKFYLGLCTGLVCSALMTSLAWADPLRVFVAASLGDAVKTITDTWPQEVVVSAAGSGTIARQVDLGAPADVIMLANLDWMNWLDARGKIQTDTRAEPVGNLLVLVGPAGAGPLADVDRATLLARLGSTGRIAMGEHRSVPAGQYAAEWFKSQGLWSVLRPRLAEVDNVRAALALVSRGEVPLAMVYQSDLVVAPDAATPVWNIPVHEQPNIRYGVAAVTPKGTDLARALAAPEAVATFARFGFLPVAP